MSSERSIPEEFTKGFAGGIPKSPTSETRDPITDRLRRPGSISNATTDRMNRFIRGGKATE